MLFDEKFLEEVENNPILAIENAIDKCYQNIIHKSITNVSQEDYEKYVETYTLIESIIESFKLKISKSSINIIGESTSDILNIQQYLSDVKTEANKNKNLLNFENMKNRFKKDFNNGFFYEFSEGDINIIQRLINELREEINKSELFEEEHKKRLLKRLEKLQSEMHKKMSDIDSFWGLVGDAGVAIGKFGKDAKPFVDRIKEITDIVWRTQSRAEELPSGSPSPLIEAEIIDEV